MCRGELIPVKRWVSLDVLGSMIRCEKDSRVLKRLLFIKHRYEGDHVSVAAGKVMADKSTGYEWQERWNECGYEGLKPHFKGGAPSKLDDEQKESLMEALREKGPIPTGEARKLILDKFGVSYSIKQVWVILKNFEMFHAKPYTKDYRKPDDCEGILKKN